MRVKSLVPLLYILFMLLPIYWLLNMSFKSTNEILGGFSWYPETFTFDNYRAILCGFGIAPPEGERCDMSWANGFINSLVYVSINTVVSVAVALPAAYAFSRYKFIGDKHLFFWLLTNRMAPPAVFVLPFINLYYEVPLFWPFTEIYSGDSLFDTHIAVALAHCLFNIPLAVWILEGFMSGVPKQLDETAKVDGYSFFGFFFRIFLPAIKAGVGVAAFFCFMFSWVEMLLAKSLTSVNAKPIVAEMTKTASS